MRKSYLIARMLRCRDEWEALINHVGLLRVGIQGVSGRWSVKNIVAHIMSHEQFLADHISALGRGEPRRPSPTPAALQAFMDEFGYPDFDSPLLSEDSANEWVFQKYRNAPMNDVVADELHAFDALLAAVRSLPEDRLEALGLPFRILHVTCEHYRLHGADIRKRFKRPQRQI
ncbi:MAG: DinB family protein [Bacteroidota bacterium]